MDRMGFMDWMHRIGGVALAAMLAWAGPGWAAPDFGGAKEALAAPGAAVIRWQRADPQQGKGAITYRIYERRGTGWNLGRPIGETRGNEFVATGLSPDREYAFVVRARDASGEDANRRAVRVRPQRREPAAEWRAAWVTRFEWPGGSRAEVEKRLRGMMETLAEARLNAVVFQVRGQGDTLYASAEEPWSAALSADARAGDPVGLAIREAHRNGLQFHAWFNLSTIWQSRNKSAPADRKHPFYRFANAADPGGRAGLIHDANGRPKQWGEDDYVWLTPGNPEVNAYLRRQVVAFLQRYDVDGIHFDDRTGNPNGPSRDPVSLARFRSRGNPMRIADFGAWQREQLARLLSDIYVAAKAAEPGLLVSAAPFGIADKRRIPGYGKFKDGSDFGVDPEGWLARGVIDALMPQIYWDLPDPEPNFGTVLRDWMANNKTGRPIWPGSALGKFGSVQPLDPVQVRYVALARALGAGGNIFFSWGQASAGQWRAAGKKLYQSRARVPVPAHMGRVGHAMGTVTAKGRPVADAWLRIGDQDYAYLSSADGFFAIPNLKPGTYKILASLADNSTQMATVRIEAGKVARVAIAF